MTDFDVLPMVADHRKSASDFDTGNLEDSSPAGLLLALTVGTWRSRETKPVGEMIPSVIDNQQHFLADALNALLERCHGGPLDIATAYFAVSGYKLVRERLRAMGAVRLLIGAEPKTGSDVGLRPDRQASPHPNPLPVASDRIGEGMLQLLRGDLEAEPFREETLRLVEELIAFSAGRQGRGAALRPRLPPRQGVSCSIRTE